MEHLETDWKKEIRAIVTSFGALRSSQ
jgi:hypothetical protein